MDLKVNPLDITYQDLLYVSDDIERLARTCSMLGKDEKGIQNISQEPSYGSVCSGIRSLGDVMWIHLA
jgi:hypothetical protein